MGFSHPQFTDYATVAPHSVMTLRFKEQNEKILEYFY